MRAVAPASASALLTDRGETLLQRRLRVLETNASSLLGEALPPSDAVLTVHGGETARLARVADVTRAQIRLSAPGSERLGALVELALRCADARRAVREHRLERRRRALTGFSSAISRMGRLVSAEELIHAVCVEVVEHCGFTRAMLSRVCEGRWSPWQVHVSHRHVRTSDRLWMAATRVPIDLMPVEQELLHERRAGFVGDTATDARVSASLVRELATHSYAAVPIALARDVVGFIHADHYPRSRRVDEIDAMVLGEFAHAFSSIYERAVLLDHLRAQRNRALEAMRAAEAIVHDLVDAEVELVRGVDRRLDAGSSAVLSVVKDSPDVDRLLTPREREVVALIVRGQPNAAIAERLVISEATVKSHVQQILRKLGATNRSEVVARCLGMALVG